MSDVKSDPFAAIAAQQAAASTPPPAAAAPAQHPAGEDPFLSAHDAEDPFATSDDFRGGPFTPSPPIELLRGRLLAMFPRKFEANADNPHKVEADPSSYTREMYTVDLYVLDGGPLKFQYKIKADPNKGTEERYEEFDAGTPSAENPFVIKSHWVPQGAIIGKLKGSHRKGAPFLGVLDLGAQAAERKKGTTDAQIRAKYDAWVSRNRVGDKPKYSWAMDAPAAERRKVAIEFWAAHKDGIVAINAATAPAEDR